MFLIDLFCSNMDEDTMKMRKDFLSRIASLEKELKVSAAENEKAIKSLQNEKSVLTAAVEAREAKIIRLAELQSQVAELEKIAEERDSLRFELVSESICLSHMLRKHSK